MNIHVLCSSAVSTTVAHLAVLTAFMLTIQFSVPTNALADGLIRPSRYLVYTDTMRNPNYALYPFSNYLNTALDSTQSTRSFSQKDYLHNHREVFDMLANPVKAINRDGGFVKFLNEEWGSSRAAPNYTLHLIGGGYDYRLTAEWFDYNGFPVPYLLSFVTTYLGRIGNKAVEAANPPLKSHNHLSDLLFFDIVGNLFFMSDDVTRFFVNTLGLHNWAGQPMLDAKNLRIINAGNYYILRPRVLNDYIRPFVLMGMQYLFGFSIAVDPHLSLTLCGGLAVDRPFYPDFDAFRDSVKKSRPAGGVFIDRDGTLLASLIINGTENYRLRLNIYPALLKVDYFNVGLFLALTDYNRVVAGISFCSVLGFGMSL